MKVWSFRSKMLLLSLASLLTLSILWFVRKSRNPQVNPQKKPITLPKAVFVPRRLPWHWTLQQADKPQDWCKKAYGLLEALCEKAEQAWACHELCWQAKEGSVEEQHWRSKRNAIWQRQGEQEEDCYKLYQVAERGSAEEQRWRTKMNTIWQKQCEQEESDVACQNLYYFVEDSSERKKWRDKGDAISQKKCEKGQKSACVWLYDNVDLSAPPGKQLYEKLQAALRKQCEQGENLWSCRRLSERGEYDTTQLYKERKPLWRKQCEQEKNDDVCLHLLSIAKEDPSESKYWENLYVDAKKRKCLAGNEECSEETFAGLSGSERALVVKSWEARCQENSEDCRTLFDFYYRAGTCEEQMPSDQPERAQSKSIPSVLPAEEQLAHEPTSGEQESSPQPAFPETNTSEDSSENKNGWESEDEEQVWREDTQ